MATFSDSLDTDSLQDNFDRLKDEAKQKNQIIEDYKKIIASLKEQINELQDDNEELEKNEQLLKQKIDQTKKESADINETLEAVSRARTEVETAYDTLNKRYNARLGQLQKFVDELAQTKKNLHEAESKIDHLQAQNELLQVELDTAKAKKRDRQMDNNYEDLKAQILQLSQQNTRLSQQLEQQQRQLLQQSQQLQQPQQPQPESNEEMVQELYDLRAQVKSLSHRQSRRSIDEEILKLKEELNVTETSWRLERQHKERYARENCQLDRKVNELTKDLTDLMSKYSELEKRLRDQPPPPLPPKTGVQPLNPLVCRQPQIQDENRSDITAKIHFSMADEVGEIMDSSSITATKRLTQESALWGNQQSDFRHKRSIDQSLGFSNNTQNHVQTNFCANHRIKKSTLYNDPIAEQKLRLERANELVRRNMQTKPLHQTSYPLELDTFDTTNLTETEIKRGEVRRQALADQSNQGKPIKKSEAFIV